MTIAMAATKKRKPRILIAGLGNLLLMDDGVGVHAVRELEKDPPPDVVVADVGTAVLDALPLFEEANRILAIDALAAGGAPGTVYACGVRDVADEGIKASLHELSLVSALKFLRDRARRQVMVLGVEPAVIDFGLQLSPAVAAALPRVVRAARRIVALWQGTGGDLAGRKKRAPGMGSKNPGYSRLPHLGG